MTTDIYQARSIDDLLGIMVRSANANLCIIATLDPGQVPGRDKHSDDG